MSDPVVDLRSDTVTRPSQGMREAMLGAEVGDDVLDHDPTTLALETRVAGLLGKEKALFFPSGVQANQTALAVHGRPGTEGRGIRGTPSPVPRADTETQSRGADGIE